MFKELADSLNKIRKPLFTGYCALLVLWLWQGHRDISGIGLEPGQVDRFNRLWDQAPASAKTAAIGLLALATGHLIEALIAIAGSLIGLARPRLWGDMSAYPGEAPFHLHLLSRGIPAAVIIEIYFLSSDYRVSLAIGATLMIFYLNFLSTTLWQQRAARKLRALGPVEPSRSRQKMLQERDRQVDEMAAVQIDKIRWEGNIAAHVEKKVRQLLDDSQSSQEHDPSSDIPVSAATPLLFANLDVHPTQQPQPDPSPPDATPQPTNTPPEDAETTEPPTTQGWRRAPVWLLQRMLQQLQPHQG